MTRTIIDSHIHLWPKETSNEDGHAWMTPGMPLAKPHLLSNYRQAARQERNSETNVTVEGVVYVETDVRYDTPNGSIMDWAKGPLDEIRFLRSVIEGHYANEDSPMLLGLVPWAPMNQPTTVLEEYLDLAEQIAGIQTWKRVRGFRFLLQFIHHQAEFEQLVFGDAFIANLKLLGSRGFSFDIGVDQRSGGSWQLEAVGKAMKMAQQDVPEREQVIFVVNHLCKPNFSADESDFDRWATAIQTLSALPKTYMKLSGAFSELPSEINDTNDIVRHLRPWVKHVFQCFGTERVMYSSDWPVP